MARIRWTSAPSSTAATAATHRRATRRLARFAARRLRERFARIPNSQPIINPLSLINACQTRDISLAGAASASCPGAKRVLPAAWLHIAVAPTRWRRPMTTRRISRNRCLVSSHSQLPIGSNRIAVLRAEWLARMLPRGRESADLDVAVFFGVVTGEGERCLSVAQTSKSGLAGETCRSKQPASLGATGGRAKLASGAQQVQACQRQGEPLEPPLSSPLAAHHRLSLIT